MLVSTVLKLFRYLTTRVFWTQFHCSKSIFKNSISMRCVVEMDQKIHVELESPSFEDTDPQQKNPRKQHKPTTFHRPATELKTQHKPTTFHRPNLSLSFMGLEIGTALFLHFFTNSENKKVTLFPFYFDSKSSSNFWVEPYFIGL